MCSDIKRMGRFSKGMRSKDHLPAPRGLLLSQRAGWPKKPVELKRDMLWYRGADRETQTDTQTHRHTHTHITHTMVIT